MYLGTTFQSQLSMMLLGIGLDFTGDYLLLRSLFISLKLFKVVIYSEVSTNAEARGLGS